MSSYLPDFIIARLFSFKINFAFRVTFLKPKANSIFKEAKHLVLFSFNNFCKYLPFLVFFIKLLNFLSQSNLS